MSGQEQPEAGPDADQAEPISGAETRRMLAGRYELGDRLGRGGMGTVWRARDLMLDREVAVKELTVNHLPEEDLAILQSRMKQEARAAARIKHGGVITIHDVLEQDGRPWIVMELIDGRSLADVVAQDGPLSPREAAEVGTQVLAALHRGHQLGVLHRDVKPANVLLESGTGRVVLLDFGIAKFEGSSELTRPGDLVGSPDYLAPERAQGERPGPASDLWGLGATLYAAVEGQSPFRRHDPLSTLAAVVSEPLPHSRNAGALGPVLAALMAKDAKDRPEADEALRMLREVTAGHTMEISARPSVIHRTPTQSVPVVDRPAQAEPLTPAEPAAPAQKPVEPPAHSGPPGYGAQTTPLGPTGPTGPTAALGTQQTGPTPADPAARAARRRRGLRLALLGLTAAVLSGAVAFGVVRFERSTQTPVADPSTSPSAPPSSAPPTTVPSSAPTTPSATVPAGPAPSGFKWVTDPAGFRFPEPLTGGNWQRHQDPKTNNIFYSPDGNKHYFQFAIQVGQPLPPLEHLAQLDQSLNANPSAGTADYQQESLAAAQVHGYEAARWVFTYTNTSKDGNGGPRRSIEEEYRDSQGTSYAMLVCGPAGGDDQTLTENRFTTLLNGFTPVSQ
ncbi:protein kinase [Kitasatospora sp. NBC_01287]|uniref:serine/threonine-protein kinase n=1 Tax=Kitasatospora sp. NBC_01287 TaxID=2903573 RepID=UPI00224D56A2|nr:serine/threonine protein kinase [Kitasatospora sp. NBC_01287]MCX4748538.1 protein kinase [Kitasatospora sp. NBC_01287]